MVIAMNSKSKKHNIINHRNSISQHKIKTMSEIVDHVSSLRDESLSSVSFRTSDSNLTVTDSTIGIESSVADAITIETSGVADEIEMSLLATSFQNFSIDDSDSNETTNERVYRPEASQNLSDFSFDVLNSTQLTTAAPQAQNDKPSEQGSFCLNDLSSIHQDSNENSEAIQQGDERNIMEEENFSLPEDNNTKSLSEEDNESRISNLSAFKAELKNCSTIAELEVVIQSKLHKLDFATTGSSDVIKKAKELGLEALVRQMLTLIRSKDDDYVEQFRLLKLVVEDIRPHDKDDLEPLHNVVGKMIAKLIVMKTKPKECRQFLSILCSVMTRSEAISMIGRHISNREWADANKHKMYPGPGVPLATSFLKNYRKRVEDTTLIQFIEWLKAADHLQNMSFGQKIVNYSNGLFVAIESVKRTATIKNIIKDYYQTFLNASSYENENYEESETEDDLEDDLCQPPALYESSSGSDYSDGDSDSSDDTRDSNSSDDNRDSDDDSNDSVGRRHSTNAADDDGDSVGNQSKSPSEGRICEEKQRQSGLCCYLPHGHTGRHKYTRKGLLSPSLMEKIIKELTSGGLKSRAGLDNIYVKKGFENFEVMRSLIDIMANAIDEPGMYKNKNDILESINETEEFYKIGFPDHFSASKVENQHSCGCLKCGFYDKVLDPIPCECNHKDYACKDCQNSFKIIEDMYQMHDDAFDKLKSTDAFDTNPALQDDALTWRKDIDLCFENLVAYRSHIAQKESEAKFDQDHYFDLKPGECVAIFDYKMKIMSSKYREAQEDWFAKRGSSVLGAEIHMCLPSGEKKVVYHFFISDDTNQNSEAILCAKHYLYSVVLPTYGIKSVKFRCDGAGAFNSKQIKAAMKVWDDLARACGGCYEKAYKVMVAGCGKTALDGK